jgi:hypothetical protein
MGVVKRRARRKVAVAATVAPVAVVASRKRRRI